MKFRNYCEGVEMKNKLEELAELEHEQWMKWAKNLLPTLKKIVNDFDKDTKNDIEKRIKRWKEECFKDYKDLTEEMKEFDREWARKVLKIVE
jgi:gas vesicle protein